MLTFTVLDSKAQSCLLPKLRAHRGVVKAADARLTEADVIAHCRKKLADYKSPKQMRFVEALPKSTIGKTLRRELTGLV